MAAHKSISPATTVVILFVVILIMLGVGHKIFLTPKGGAEGKRMSPADV